VRLEGLGQLKNLITSSGIRETKFMLSQNFLFRGELQVVCYSGRSSGTTERREQLTSPISADNPY
jgi:hypothetical protein